MEGILPVATFTPEQMRQKYENESVIASEQSERGNPLTDNSENTPLNLPESQADYPQGNARTGIKYLDDKIANNNVSMLDAYIARNYLGLDLNVTLNGNLNLKQSLTDRNKAYKDMYATMRDLNTTEEYLSRIQDNSGFWNGLSRIMHKASGGLTPISDENKAIAQIENEMKYANARAATGADGKVSNMQLDMLNGNTFAHFANSKEKTSGAVEIARRQYQNLLAYARQAQMLTGQVPQEVLNTLAKWKKILGVGYGNEKERLRDIDTISNHFKNKKPESQANDSITKHTPTQRQ